MYIAEDRAGRPNDFVAEEPDREVPAGAESCPFCPQNESQTPPSLLQVPPDGDWRVRVIPNKYPAMQMNPFGVGGSSAAEHDWPALVPAVKPPLGSHEVVIESRRHVASIRDLSVAEFAEALLAAAARVAYWREHPQIAYAYVFKNEGYDAGASLHHVHSQLVAMPELPPLAETEVALAESYHEEHGRPILADYLRSEEQIGERLVLDGGEFVALSHGVARQPYEMLVAPREGGPSFGELTAGSARNLASVLLRVLAAASAWLDPMPFNLIFRSAPSGDRYSSSCRWYVELVPRSCRLAGFEWGSGMYINPVSPERAAERLRRSISGSAPA